MCSGTMIPERVFRSCCEEDRREIITVYEGVFVFDMDDLVT